MKLEGIILAAGMGTRMRPLTESIPKPLLPVTGVSLLELAAGKLLRAGVSRLHINLFHLGDRIRKFAEAKGWPVVFHEEEELLDTGGGIGNMAAGLSDADHVFLHNGDVISSIDLEDALEFHKDRGALVTMILMKPGEPGHTPPGAVMTDGEGNVTDIGPSLPGLGYTGIAVIAADALDRFPLDKKGLVPILLEMIAERAGNVAGYDASSAGEIEWGETGSPSSYLELHRRILVEGARFDEALPTPGLPLRAGTGASIDPSAGWRGFLDVGEGAVIERDTFLEDCVVLAGAAVRKGARYRRAIIHDDCVMEVE
jgi:mannose-1-phosphate guanylyltransferase/phosphomannomutase